VLVNRPRGSAESRLTDFNLCLCHRTVKSLSFFVFEKQFFSEQIDAIFQSLQFRHLGASDPEGF
jgi:hypothetical protein